MAARLGTAQCKRSIPRRNHTVPRLTCRPPCGCLRPRSHFFTCHPTHHVHHVNAVRQVRLKIQERPLRTDKIASMKMEHVRAGHPERLGIPKCEQMGAPHGPRLSTPPPSAAAAAVASAHAILACLRACLQAAIQARRHAPAPHQHPLVMRGLRSLWPYQPSQETHLTPHAHMHACKRANPPAMSGLRRLWPPRLS